MENTSDIALQLFYLACMGLFLLVFLGGGGYLIYRSNLDRNKTKQSLTWPSTQGRVIESRVVEGRSTDSDGDTSKTFRPYVKYDYQVIGTTFTSDKLSIGPAVSTSNLRKTQDKVNGLPPGAVVTVFYNPDDPAEAVLEQRSNAPAMLVVGIILVFIGLCVLIPVGISLVVNWF